VHELVNISIPDAAVYALLGYLVVFFGLVLLMVVIMTMGKIMGRKKAVPAPAAAAPAAAAPAPAPVKAEPAPGTAGELKLYDTDPRDAAMCMAIVADTLGKPLNELRFISIREVKEDEV
jgi:Na+-transporting methylmalonyl-CoA/oxaloacetate decarboxylase gamma subunit